MNATDKRLRKLLEDPNNVMKAQVIMLNELSIRYIREKNADLKKQLKTDIETIALATNSIKNIEKYRESRDQG